MKVARCFAFGRIKAPCRPFDDVDIMYVANECGLTFNMDLNSPFRWTPLIQKVQQSQDFLNKMRYFQRLKIMEDEHYGELIDAFVFEALKGSEFDYYYDYECKHNGQCPFHGTVDFLIYNKQQHMPIVPVLTALPNTGFTSFGKSRDMNIGQAAAVGLWTLTNMFAAQKIECARVLQSDGNNWRMIEMNTDGKFRKTGVYGSNNEHSKIYFDYEMQQIVLGLIRFSLNKQEAKEEALKQIYDFVDERRFLVESNEKPQVSKLWGMLPKKVRSFFFDT